MSTMAGLATDATLVYMLKGSGDVVTTPLADIALTPGTAVSAVGTVHAVQWGVDGAPSLPSNIMRLSISYSHGCLFITSGENTEGSTQLYCIDVSDWSVTEVSVPASYPLPEGYYYTFSSLIDFPDGRIGKVSKYVGVTGGYESTLRTYTVTGTGASVSIDWSQDYLMFDDSFFAVDEHGIATDGTYLYRIQWKDYNPNYKTWALTTGSAASVVFAGNFTQPFGNMHYLAHNHIANYYLVGYYDQNQFFITAAADPGPGPGNPLNPTFGVPTSTSDGCTVSVSNYDPAFTWGTSATSGSVSVNSSGDITVTGLAPGAGTTVTVTTARSGFPDGSVEVSCSASPPVAPGVPTSVLVKAENGRVSVSWQEPASDGGSAIVSYTARVLDEFGDPVVGAECTVTTVLYCSIEGLANGAAYQLEVLAHNAIGDSAWTTPIVFTPGDPVLVSLPGVDSSALTVSDNTPMEGGTETLIAFGFRPGSQVDFWLHSTPTLLGSSIANASGTATLVVGLPLGFVGAHSAQSVGINTAGDVRNLSQPLTISAAELAATGAEAMPILIIGTFALGMGVVLVLAGVRRRPTRTALRQ
jgi:hypothetical protein